MYVSETFLEVRYYETDLMGIVHHSNYIRYFECGRNKALVDMGFPIKKIEETGIMMPVVNVSCNYKVPAKQGDMLRIVSTIAASKARIIIDTVLYNEENRLYVLGAFVGFIHSDTRKPTRVPKYFADKMAPFFKIDNN